MSVQCQRQRHLQLSIKDVKAITLLEGSSGLGFELMSWNEEGDFRCTRCVLEYILLQR